MLNKGLSSRGSSVVLAFIILGLSLRLIRYLQNFPVWCDESMLAVNLLGRSWANLAEPLDYRQVCPLGFFAGAWGVVQVLGFSESSLRLIPIVSALLSVLVFSWLARRLFGPGSTAYVLAIGLFAVAQPPIRFAAEFKPYATDLLAATVLILLAVLKRQEPGRARWSWILAAIAPGCVAVSLPSLFVIAGVAVVGFVEILKRRQVVSSLTFLAFLMSAGLGVGLMAWLGQYHSSPEDRAYFLEFWAGGFPPGWRDPGRLVSWLIRVQTGPLFAYPHGPTRLPGSLNILVFLLFGVGAVVWFQRDRGMLALLVLPFMLNFVAAILRRYPYGMSPRVAQFLVPSTLILVASGLESILERVRSEVFRERAVRVLIGLCLMLGIWRLGADLGKPYRTPWDQSAREFARWFWNEQAADAEIVCVQNDLKIPFRPERWSYDAADQYLCYQRIYSRRHRLDLTPRWESISSGRPLRCVLLNRFPHDVPGFRDWMNAQADRYALREVRVYPASRGVPGEPAQVYVVCEFFPVSPVTAVGNRKGSVRK